MVPRSKAERHSEQHGHGGTWVSGRPQIPACTLNLFPQSLPGSGWERCFRGGRGPSYLWAQRSRGTAVMEQTNVGRGWEGPLASGGRVAPSPCCGAMGCSGDIPPPSGPPKPGVGQEETEPKLSC